tara:strand:+ start:3788 stop:6139 length:2352 start_codon:yes stop_codon:yes gene_type:complete
MTPSTPLLKYLNKHNILWFPIYLEVVDGVKKLQPYRETGARPKTTDFKNLTAQEIQARHEWTTYDHIAIDTNNIQQIDIDNPDCELMECKENTPHFLSTTKKLPHFFVKFNLPEALVGKNMFKLQEHGKKVDYLNGCWSFAPRDGVVVNADIDIVSIDIPDETIVSQYKDYNTDFSGIEIKEILGGIPATCPYEVWLKIGMALKISGFSYEDWDTWSRNRAPDQQRPTEYKWEKSFESPPDPDEPEVKGKVSFGTLMMYLKQYNPIKFREVQPKLLNKEECIFIEDIEGNTYRTLTNRSVAELFYNNFQDKYVFDTDWYMFDKVSGIMKKLDKKMVEAYMLKDSMTYITNLLNKRMRTTEDEEKINKYYKIKNMTESSAFMKGSFAFKETRFADSNFKKQLDTSQQIFGFNNGVWDMDVGVFRKGVKTDYVSQYVNFDWVATRDHDFFDNLIFSMFEDQEMADWFKKHLGSIFVGGNPEEHFYFWDGAGRNGKGTMDTLLKSILGKFYCPLDVSYFTVYKKNDNAPEPHLLKMKDTKCVMINELGESTKLITNKIKQISGNDSIPARALYSNDVIDIDCAFKCIIQTNHLPVFTDIDDGLLNRICPIHFPFMFVSDSVFDAENPQHRRANIELKGVCKEKKVEFFNYVMDICVPAYQNHGITPLPRMVQKNINKYRSQIDDVGAFALTELKEATFLSGKEPITTNSMYNHYQAWREQVVETEEKVSRDKFAKRLKSILGEGAYKRAMVDHKKQSCIVGYEFVNAYEYTPKTNNNNNNIYSRDY